MYNTCVVLVLLFVLVVEGICKMAFIKKVVLFLLSCKSILVAKATQPNCSPYDATTNHQASMDLLQVASLPTSSKHAIGYNRLFAYSNCWLLAQLVRLNL